MKIRNIIILCCIALWPLNQAVAQTFNVDFSKWTDKPLVKGKFDVYQTPLIQASKLLNCNPRLEEIGIQNLRYEIGWGKPCELNYPQIQGTSPNFIYNFTNFDKFLEGLNMSNIKPILALGYTPQPLKIGNNEMNMFTDLEGWQKINRDYAAHFREKLGKSFPIYEVWNEPDFSMFFKGSLQDYKKIYQYAVKGLREGDPEAIVGGPALAFTPNWIDTLLTMTHKDNLPLDFLSGHSYGDPASLVNSLHSSLSRNPDPHVPLYMTEYGSYRTDGSMSIGSGGNQERYMSAMWFFRDVNIFLNYSDLTNVFWAQWVDVEVTNDGKSWFPGGDKLGLMTLDNHKKAMFNAFKIYYQMPVDRCVVTPIQSNELYTMASVDPNNAGIVIWNTSTTAAKSAKINLLNLPFSTGNIEVYRINSLYGSYIDKYISENLNPISSESKALAGNNDSWSGSIPAQSLVYLKLNNNNTDKSLLDPCPIGSFNRHMYWFYNRNSPAYANFDKMTSIARVGTGSDASGHGIVAAQFDSIVTDLHIQVKKNGDFKALDKNSLFGIRFDYYNGSAFTKSLLVHGGIYNKERTTIFPFGTKSTPNEDLLVEDFNNNKDFTLDLKKYAPEGWAGKTIVTFEIQNTGANTRAAIYLSKKAKDLTTGLRPTELKINEKTLSIYPNPVKDNDFRIDLSSFEIRPVSVSIVDLLGHQCFKKDSEFNDYLCLHSNQFKKGVYLVVAETGAKRKVRTLIIN